MEDILAIIVVLATVGVIVYIVSKIIAHRREQAEAEARQKEFMDKLNAAATRDRERVLAKIVEKPLHQESESDLAYMREHNLISATEQKEALRKKRQYKKRTVEPTPTPTPVETTSSSSLLSDLADVATIVNVVHHWNDNPAHRVEHSPEPEPSVGVTTKESSWGFDDSDSRKSISSSMDTSSSWSSSSSSSSDYSSSSDSSSPSSDW